MKKVFSVFLLAVMLVQLCACGDSSSKTVTCPTCSAELSETAAFCQNCGGKVGGNRTCAGCGAENESGARFCSACGEALAEGSLGGGSESQTDANGQNSFDTGGDTDDNSITGTCFYDLGNECKGHPCTVCNQKGYIVLYDNVTADCLCDDGIDYCNKTIPVIPGDGETARCTKCEGGYVTCFLCEGTGKFGSYTVGGYNGSGGTEVQKICTQCLGLKKTKCRNCGGDGKVKPEG